jgi:hypothetical protein
MKKSPMKQQTPAQKKNLKDASTNKNMQAPFKPGEKRAVADPKAMAMKKTSPAKMKDVSKKTAYNIKEASNQKLTASARKHYAENAQAAMKNKKKK